LLRSSSHERLSLLLALVVELETGVAAEEAIPPAISKGVIAVEVQAIVRADAVDEEAVAHPEEAEEVNVVEGADVVSRTTRLHRQTRHLPLAMLDLFQPVTRYSLAVHQKSSFSYIFLMVTT